MHSGVSRFPWLKITAASAALGLHAVVLAMVLSSPVAQVAQGQPQVLDVQFVELAPAGPAPRAAVDSQVPVQAAPEPVPVLEQETEPEPDHAMSASDPQAITDSQPPQAVPKPIPEPRPKPRPKPRPIHKPRPAPPAKAEAAHVHESRAAPVAADASSADRPDSAAAPAAQGQPRAVAPDQPRIVGQVDYLGKRPTPVYPRLSERRGEQGRVVLRVLISPQGGVADVKIQHSSGYARLDEAAVQAMRQAHFRPYTENGIAHSARVDIPFDFVL